MIQLFTYMNEKNKCDTNPRIHANNTNENPD